MKIALFLCLLVYAGHLNAQSDTTVLYLDANEKPCPEEGARRYAILTKEGDHWKKVVFDIMDDKPYYGAYYSDAACTVFDGPYSSFNKNGKINSAGRYANNKKNGLWRSFADNGRLTDSTVYKDGFITGLALGWFDDGSLSDSLIFEDNGKGIAKGFWNDRTPRQAGSFLEGKKSGHWTYFYRNGIKCQEVEYLADSAISYTCYDEKGNLQTKDCYYEKEAAYKGGDGAWQKYLSKRLSSVTFPDAYYEGRIYGKIYIQYVVDKEGNITDVKALNSIHPALDEIALSIIRKSPRWEPAVQFNRKVNAYRIQPITFPKAKG